MRKEFEEYMVNIKNDYNNIYDPFSYLENSNEDRLIQKYSEFVYSIVF